MMSKCQSCVFSHTHPFPTHLPLAAPYTVARYIILMSNSLDLTPSAELTPHHLPPCPLSHLTSHYSLVWL